ncbi:hypothetical protein ASPSYDRAFT_1049656 [Aspergillus sydowii CBS 593.65]|uniref:Uncharacterized protein n=1 Tax=Aspergillus sydowii CBS 593.65 TaxID=1036612 RepID=A0A1L9TCZ1_9EURO|nr:uncharacterized protein ASPSYDRAFT_1049656 [Aspergillus sydowii CBS 593.65]OJJ57300.1 hypothetical protein ASPSYDRAFT_1049656 [Aspergillus sydowii CBS 593.65]
MGRTKYSSIPRLFQYLISNNTLFFLARGFMTDCPPHSPGLNPIEHPLDILKASEA